MVGRVDGLIPIGIHHVSGYMLLPPLNFTQGCMLPPCQILSYILFSLFLLSWCLTV